ncbi:sugar phosphate isomerase/epimerase [Erwinia toletana]|uniref:Sugar phosphate isomerase/epimerase n=1 Tax=Winslowiella toletana TaxID=92490 RepID=A0ABS4P5A1_9GAMM|nr:sugar phosphate isomerase/epimerase family protein [Winslowiella toletana]MBP2167806.1 sugar phosphate isomerase/epimerase [Winslowiella toletana]
MAIGLSTYAFFWRSSARVPAPLNLAQMLEQTAAMGVKLFQICDYPQIESWSDTELQALRQQADRLGIELELGTRGLQTSHLQRYLQLASILQVTVIRSMFNSASHRPTLVEAAALIETILPQFERQQVKLCLETYEQVNSAEMMAVITRFPSAYLGVCLDPANCVAALEQPQQVIANTAGRVLNLHIKDFAFSRQEGWVGFTLAGAPLGEGLLDYDLLIAQVRPDERGINQIVEHWLPWQQDAQSTCQREAEWTQQSVDFLRHRQPQE